MMRITVLILGLLGLAGFAFYPADGARGALSPDAPRTIAVLSFENNSGNPQYDPLGKGIAAMMISDLSAVPSVQLVERERLQDLLAEQNLQQTKHFDPATAARLGRFVGAEYVVAGAVMAMDPRIRIDTRVIRVETAEVVKTAQVTGQEDKFFELQQKLAGQLIDDLEIALSPEDREMLRERQEKNRIDEMHSILAFSHAMDLADYGDYVGAAEKMYPVVRAHPNSMLASLTYDAMKQKAARDTKRKARDKLRGFIRKRIPE